VIIAPGPGQLDAGGGGGAAGSKERGGRLPDGRELVGLAYTRAGEKTVDNRGGGPRGGRFFFLNGNGYNARVTS